MDILQETALKYQSILRKQYFFEIAKKQNMRRFVLSFEKADFFHLAGLHKLKDVTAMQTEKNKGVIFNNIVNGMYDNIEKSIFFGHIKKRLLYLGNIERLLDSNQIIFQYLENRVNGSYIKADYLMESTKESDIIFIFLNDRNRSYGEQDIPQMCCRSFFPMEKLDYSKNQPVYTLLKKIKIDIPTGQKIIQYDRSDIMRRSKQAPTEQERRSVLQQLNEKKAQMAVNEVLQKKRELEPINKNRQER